MTWRFNRCLTDRLLDNMSHDAPANSHMPIVYCRNGVIVSIRGGGGRGSQKLAGLGFVEHAAAEHRIVSRLCLLLSKRKSGSRGMSQALFGAHPTKRGDRFEI